MRPYPPPPTPYLQIVEEHCSVEQSRRAQAEPISLDSCLKAFTSEEELGEDELYYCSKCKTHRLATKKLDLWRLPPILVCFCFGLFPVHAQDSTCGFCFYSLH